MRNTAPTATCLLSVVEQDPRKNGTAFWRRYSMNLPRDNRGVATVRGLRTRVTDGPDVWIVDWDIPVGPHRFRFYRQLKQLRKKLGLVGRMSTMSVLITQDQELALAVFTLAAGYTDRVHLYAAKEAHV